jgi:hypothetical protein
MPPDDIWDEIDAILDGAKPVARATPRIFETPPSPAEVQRAELTRVAEGLGSEDANTRAASSAAIDQFIRKLGLSWEDVVDAIARMGAIENWRADWHERAPRSDTEWTRFVDDDGRVGFGRWLRGRALTVRISSRTGASWFVAINGDVSRGWNNKPRLFRSPDSAKLAVEKFAGEK